MAGQVRGNDRRNSWEEEGKQLRSDGTAIAQQWLKDGETIGESVGNKWGKSGRITLRLAAMGLGRHPAALVLG